MNKTQEALKLALEALKELRMLGMNMQWHDSWLAKSETAITAIREALAEQPAQQQEPLPNKVLADAYQCGFHAGRKSAEILPPECRAGDLDCSHAERLCNELREKNS